MISLCMIAKDEEQTIGRAIESVKPIVSEIVVVDTGSKDNTKEIAKSFGAKVFDYKWDNDFSRARNFALDRCTKPWILVLDADETISRQDLPKVKELIKKGGIAYRLIQRTYSNEKKDTKWNDNDDKYEESKGFAGWQYRGIVRFFRNLPEIKFVYPIHESVKPDVLKIGTIMNANIPIHHFPKNTKEKEEKYLELLQKKIKEHPSANSYAELAVHLKEIGRIDEAKESAKKANELNKQIKIKI